jgi:hypothetical protein
MVPWASAEKRNARSQDIHPETQLADATFDPGQLVTIWEVTIKKKHIGNIGKPLINDH